MAMLTEIRVPQITQEELYAFHETHFSASFVTDFFARYVFTQEAQAALMDGEGLFDDPFGNGETEKDYDNDEAGAPVQLPLDLDDTGVLDDEDSDAHKPFRASAAGARVTASWETSTESAETQETGHGAPGKKRRRRKNNNNNNNVNVNGGNSANNNHSNGGGPQRNEKKPDLRKRTWDVVDTGLGSLDYDDVEQPHASAAVSAQRRRVHYGED
ncbi:hypothetical protein SPI_00374 [Niveomyces insectorum RCEF 264]|uniref:Uncharacterized protein n=1 Tax=Niveomyces insectorum RCEF 264 TaxID=1081102 RepID=A0A162MPV3_9HYPO|nr:hypothetical protein SPI_00374 [Niveomyces insectorum RCEF 264]